MADKKGGLKHNDRLQIVMKKVSELIPYATNPRKNEQTALKLKKSISEFGFLNPITIDENNTIVTGHARVKAAMMLGMDEVPCIYAATLSEDEIRAYRIADNKTAELAGWDYDKLCAEMSALSNAGFDLDLSGFNEAEQFYYLDDAATPDKQDKDEFREYQAEAEKTNIQAFNVAIVCNGLRDKQYLMELIGEHRTLKRLYLGAEISGLLAAKSA